MNKPVKIPKGLDLARSCFYQLPDTATLKDVRESEQECHQHYPGMFVARVGKVFFFTLPTPHAKESFLKAMEQGATQEGILVERVMIYPK